MRFLSRSAESEPLDSKRRVEATWGITRVHHERNRYIFNMHYKERKISRELYEYLVKEGYADANLIAKWRKVCFSHTRHTKHEPNNHIHTNTARIRATVLPAVHSEEQQQLWDHVHLPRAEGQPPRRQGRRVRQLRVPRLCVVRLSTSTHLPQTMCLQFQSHCAASGKGGKREERKGPHRECWGDFEGGKKEKKESAPSAKKGDFAQRQKKERKKKKPQEIAVQQPHFFFSAAAASEEPWLMTTVVPVGSATVSLPATGVRALLR